MKKVPGRAFTIIVFFGLIYSASLALGQSSSTGGLTVTVADPTAAVIADATVVLTNTATGQTRTEKTSSLGSATFTLLPVGVYSVQISAPGFKPLQVPSVIINVTETRVLNETLTVGPAQEEVTVQSSVEALHTESDTVGTVVESGTINNLPLVTRNYTQILTMSPGAISNVANAATVGHGSPTIYVNGFLGNGNSYLMDGADVTQLNSGTPEGNFGSIAIPNPDALEEFKVLTSMYDAGYGRNAGGNINVVTKSGTNSFHGTIHEFLRNTAFDANDFFRNRSGLGLAVLKQNQYGFTLGGPIIKDKLFFFIGYQKTGQANGVDPTGSSSIIVPARLTDNRTPAALGAEFCPQNNPAGSSFANTKFGGTQVACDGSNINPVALALLNYKAPGYSTYMIPTPQTIIAPGTASAFGEALFSIPAIYNENQYLGNLDYVISSKHLLQWKYFYARSLNPRPFGANSATALTDLPGVSEGFWSNGNNNMLLRLVSTLSSTVVNEARISSTYVRATDWSDDPMTSPEFGMTPAVATFPLMPILTVNGLFAAGGTTNNGQWENSHTTQWSDQLSWIRGRQSIRIGYEGEIYYWNAKVRGIARGALTFQSFPDFLLGMSAAENGSQYSNVYSTNYQDGSPDLHEHAVDPSVFVQDDIKVNQRITLNLGLRWEYQGNVYDTRGMMFDEWWSLYQLVPIPPAGGTYAGLTMPANYPGALPAGVYRRPGNTSLLNGHAPYHDFAPRFGLAWQPFKNSNRFIIRGGYGWYFSRITFNSPQYAACCGPPMSETVSLSGVSNANSTFQVPFQPNPPVDPTIPTFGDNMESGGPVGFGPYLRTTTSSISFPAGIDPNQIPTLVINYNVNLQYALTNSLTLEGGYVNSRGLRITGIESFDVAQIASPSNPLNCGVFSSGCITTNTAANAPERLPVVGLVPGGVKQEGNFNNSQYNGLQVELRKRMSHGLQTGAAYTFSKVMNSDITSNDPLFGWRNSWGLAPQNRTQRMIINFGYTLPNYHSDQGLLGRALSGWGTSGVITIQSGTPLYFTDATGGSIYGFVGTARAQMCPGSTYSSIFTSGNLESRLNDYVNASAFCPEPILGVVNGVGGATGDGNSGRSVGTGPGQNNWDVAITKMTVVGGLREGASLEFRAEAFNALNHPQFNNPGTAVGTASLGVINSVLVAPRILQFGLKYIF